MSNESISQWIADLQGGDEVAAGRIWDQYYEKLIRLVRRKLGNVPKRAWDEDDVALSAFQSFCDGALQGRFPKLDDRDDLWKLLFTITERKAFAYTKHARRLKRGGGELRGQSVFEGPNDDGGNRWNDAVATPEPTPEFAAEFVDQVRHLLHELQDNTLRDVATRKMAGETVAEIAAALSCSERTVKRKLMVIRTVWSERLQVD